MGTSNLNLSKPSSKQKKWSSEINSNFTLIDNEVQLLQNISNAHGLYVDQNELKVNVDDTSIGINASGSLYLLGSGGANISSLTDVTITNAAEGDFLIYNGASSKWINTPGIRPTNKLSGFATTTMNASREGGAIRYHGASSSFMGTGASPPVVSITDLNVTKKSNYEINSTFLSSTPWSVTTPSIRWLSIASTVWDPKAGDVLYAGGSAIQPVNHLSITGDISPSCTLIYKNGEVNTTTLLQYNGTNATAVNGIVFGTSPDRIAVSELVSGTFLPTVEGSITSAATIYSLRNANYSKLNNKCTIGVEITFSDNASAVGDLEIKGLPFTSYSYSDAFRDRCSVLAESITLENPSSKHIFGEVVPNSTTLKIYTTGSGLNKTAMNASIPSGTLRFTLTYRTAI